MSKRNKGSKEAGVDQKKFIELITGVLMKNPRQPLNYKQIATRLQITDKEEKRALSDALHQVGVTPDESGLRLIAKQEPRKLLDNTSFRQADRRTMSDRWWTPQDLPKRFVELALIAHKQGKLSRAG